MASRLKIARVKMDLTQLGLATMAGLGQWRLSQIERGLVPRFDEATKIARALECTPEDLFTQTCREIQ